MRSMHSGRYDNKHYSWKNIECFVCLGLDVAAITKLVVETVRERDDSDFTHHSQSLETGTTEVQSKNLTQFVNKKVIYLFAHKKYNNIKIYMYTNAPFTLPVQDRFTALC